MEKYDTAEQAIDGNMTHAHCMLDTQVYTRTLRICDTYCSSTAATVDERAEWYYCTLRVHCLSCYEGREVLGIAILLAGMAYAVRGYTHQVLSIFVQSVIAAWWTHEA